jgi:hypothetical protein
MLDKATSPYVQRIKATLYIHIVYLIGIDMFSFTLQVYAASLKQRKFGCKLCRSRP